MPNNLLNFKPHSFIWFSSTILPVFVALLAVLGSPSSAAESVGAQFVGKTFNDNVYVRSEPKITSKALTKVHTDTQFDLRSDGSDWLEIVSGEYSGGFLHIRNLNLTPTAEAGSVVLQVPTSAAQNWQTVADFVCAKNAAKAKQELSWIAALNGHDTQPGSKATALVYHFSDCDEDSKPIAAPEPETSQPAVATNAAPKSAKPNHWFYDRE
jgi:hypothetical protein